MDNKNDMYWMYMLHIGMNFWAEHRDEVFYGDGDGCGAEDHLRCDDETWKEITEFCAKSGMNSLLMDLGEGIRYESHPEIATKGAWSIDRLRAEIRRLKDMGITPIPKLNFSSAHDLWLGEYAHMLSTAKYYEVCKDLIEEVVDVFEKPPLFHLGMDEETFNNQASYQYIVIRQGEQWWNDFYKNVDTLEKLNVRPWIWSDYIWHHEEEFLRKMPKSVMQSNWYYDNHFGDFQPDTNEEMWIKPYTLLDEHGFDQIPTASSWLKANCAEQTVRYCQDNLKPELLKGFLQTAWKATIPKQKYVHLAAIDLLNNSKKDFYDRKKK